MSEQILETVETLCKAIHDARAVSEKKNSEEFKRIADASADMLTKVNMLNDHKAKQEEVIKKLEVQLSRSGEKTKAEVVPQDEYKELLNGYLRGKNKPGFMDETVFRGLTSKAIDWAIENSKAMPLYISKEGKTMIRKDMVEGINPQGGYWILPEFSPTDVIKFYETNPLRQMATVVTTSTNLFRFIIDDNLSESGGWVGEQNARPGTETARIGQLDIPIHEQFAEPKATAWMLDDVTFDLVGWLNRKTQQIFNLFENSAFIAGDGSQKPRGILDYGKWTGAAVSGLSSDEDYERGALGYVKSESAGAFTYDGLVNVQLSLLEQYQTPAQWLMTRESWAEVLKLKDSQLRPLYQLANLLATGAQQVLLGKPVMLAAPTMNINQGGNVVSLPGMPVLTTGAAAAIYGDFRVGYTIVDRIGFTTITDMITEKQYVKYYTRKRLGGALTSYQSLKVLELTA